MVWLLGVKLLKTIYKKMLVLQKRALRLMYFSKSRAHAVPLFISSKILPLNMLYVETVSSIMFDVFHMTVPPNISDLFTKAKEKHMHKTRFSSPGNFYITTPRLSQTQGSFVSLELNFGTPSTINFVNSPRVLLKNKFKECCF